MAWKLTKYRRVKIENAHEWWARFDQEDDAHVITAVVQCFRPRREGLSERLLVKHYDRIEPSPSYTYDTYRFSVEDMERVSKETARGMIAVLQECRLQEVKL